MSEAKIYRRGDPHPDRGGRVFWSRNSKSRVDGTRHFWDVWISPAELDRKKKESNRRSLKWRRAHPEQVAAAKRARYQGEARAANLAAARIQNKKQRAKNRDKFIVANKAWRAANKEWLREWKRNYKRNRLKSDPVFKIKHLVARRLRLFLDNKSFIKERTTLSVIGCSWRQLRAHLESQFKPGMTWDNKHLWHIDHRIPLKTANTAERVYELFHFTNLQPLWWRENLAKGATISIPISA